MNVFEQELRRVAVSGGISNPVFAGRACYGDLGGDNRVKLQFVTQGTADRYEALKATILNREDGVVDSLLFRFADTWGKKFDHGYKDGTPYIWTYQGKSEWYAYTPTDADIKKLAGEVGGYLDVFTVHPLAREQAKVPHGERESVVKKLRDAEQGRVPHNPAAAKKDNEPEL